MKKENVIWTLIAVLFVGQAVLFTLKFAECSKKSQDCSYKKAACSYMKSSEKTHSVEACKDKTCAPAKLCKTCDAKKEANKTVTK